jgi:hypothetical protein
MLRGSMGAARNAAPGNPCDDAAGGASRCGAYAVALKEWIR